MGEGIEVTGSPFDGCDFFKCSPELDQLFAALAAAQFEMEPAKASSKNAAFKSATNREGSPYENINDIIATCRPVLPKHGLAVLQPPFTGGVVTMIGHKSGQWIWSLCRYKPDRDNIHGACGAQTYGRRYGAKGMLFLEAEDDDGNTAMGLGKNNQKNETSKAISLNDAFDTKNPEHLAMAEGWKKEWISKNPDKDPKGPWKSLPDKKTLRQIQEAFS